MLVDALDCDRPDRVVLVDAGPWGDAWNVLRYAHQREAVARVFDAWATANERPNVLWSRLVASPPFEDPVERVAQYLWLQARSAGTIPMWWSPERGRWESPSGSRTESAHARGGVDARGRVTSERAVGKPDHPGARGIQYPGTIAARIRALGQIPWDRVEVFHCDARSVDPIPGATVLMDPPYLGAPRYACLFPRADVLAVARRWHESGCRVAVCEAEPLPLPGWTPHRLPTRRRGEVPREWVTCSWRDHERPQLGLLEAAW